MGSLSVHIFSSWFAFHSEELNSLSLIVTSMQMLCSWPFPILGPWAFHVLCVGLTTWWSSNEPRTWKRDPFSVHNWRLSDNLCWINCSWGYAIQIGIADGPKPACLFSKGSIYAKAIAEEQVCVHALQRWSHTNWSKSKKCFHFMQIITLLQYKKVHRYMYIYLRYNI